MTSPNVQLATNSKFVHAYQRRRKTADEITDQQEGKDHKDTTLKRTDPMKQRVATCIAGLAFFAALAVPASLAAQSKQHHNNDRHHHYQLIDMGTFGGPMSFVGLSFNSFPDLNDRGVTVGSSATSVPTSPTSDFILCGGSTGTIPNVFHAFQWQDGTVTDLGALGTEANNCSEAGSVNASGQVSGTSEVDDIDPVLGVKELRAVLWKQGDIVNLGTLGGTLSFALGAVNDPGRVVGSATNAIPDAFSLLYLLGGSSNGTQTRAFLWQDGVIQDIGTLGGPDAVAEYVNEHSQVAGNSYISFTPNPLTGLPPLDPFLWEKEKGITDLGTLGGVWGYPAGLNNRGQVVGYSSLAADPGACTAGRRLGQLRRLSLGPGNTH